MADVNVRVLSADDADPLGFAKISEFETSEEVNITDYLLVSGYRESGKETTRRVRISDIFDHYGGDINREMNWFIPVVNNQTIHWEFHRLADVGELEGDTSAPHPILPISLIDVIGDATSERSGLLSPADKLVLDSLNLATTESDGLMSSTDKVKLNSIESNANNYVLPVATTNTIGGVKPDGLSIRVDENGVISSNAGVPSVKRCVLLASDWDQSTLTLKYETTIDTDMRNTVDVDSSSMDAWVSSRVYAISEAADGITFRCSTIPLIDIVVFITSYTVSME